MPGQCCTTSVCQPAEWATWESQQPALTMVGVSVSSLLDIQARPLKSWVHYVREKVDFPPHSNLAHLSLHDSYSLSSRHYLNTFSECSHFICPMSLYQINVMLFLCFLFCQSYVVLVILDIKQNNYLVIYINLLIFCKSLFLLVWALNFISTLNSDSNLLIKNFIDLVLSFRVNLCISHIPVILKISIQGHHDLFISLLWLNLRILWLFLHLFSWGVSIVTNFLLT